MYISGAKLVSMCNYKLSGALEATSESLKLKLVIVIVNSQYLTKRGFSYS